MKTTCLEKGFKRVSKYFINILHNTFAVGDCLIVHLCSVGVVFFSYCLIYRCCNDTESQCNYVGRQNAIKILCTTL